jgi:hypothetical protein
MIVQNFAADGTPDVSFAVLAPKGDNAAIEYE